MPESCMQGSVENFYSEMKKHEAHFKELYEAAAKKGHKLKFVARYENGKALLDYNIFHPNRIFIIYTERIM